MERSAAVLFVDDCRRAEIATPTLGVYELIVECRLATIQQSVGQTVRLALFEPEVIDELREENGTDA